MLFWTLLALMIAAAAFAVLRPLSLVPRLAEEPAGLAVYREQLAELDRDQARGVLPASEAEAARIEVSRRLLAASQESGNAVVSDKRKKIASLAALIGVPILSLVSYLSFGAPEFPDAPLAERLAQPPEKQDIGILIGRMEERLEANPNHGEGWALLAPIYLRAGRSGDAIAAQEKAIRILGSTTEREIAFGEIIRIANGRITPEAQAAFERAIALDQKSLPALFYLGLAAEQRGDAALARKYWTGVLEYSKAGDAWRVPAERRLMLLERSK